jgi:restriction system protein
MDDLVLMPWWVSLALAIVVYALLSTMLPAAMRGLAPIATFFFVAMAVISALRSWKTAAMLEGQTSLNSLRELPLKRFEDLLGEAYRRQGYRVKETLGGGADGGVDLVLARGGDVILVQCKRWREKPVPVQVVRELYGVLHDRRAGSAKLVVTTNFTQDAVAFAKGKPIELVDADALLRLLRDVQRSGKVAARAVGEARDHLAPDCPLCGSEMNLRTARRGTNTGQKFWGCSNFPACRGTRDL